MEQSENPEVWLGEDGILRVHYSSRVTLASAHRAFYKQLVITKDSLPVLVVGSRIFDVDVKAERFASTPEVVSQTLALGIVTNSEMAKHFAKLFMWFRKPPFPTKLFTSESAALDWLQKFVPTNRKTKQEVVYGEEEKGATH